MKDCASVEKSVVLQKHLSKLLSFLCRKRMHVEKHSNKKKAVDGAIEVENGFVYPVF